MHGAHFPFYAKFKERESIKRHADATVVGGMR